MRSMVGLVWAARRVERLEVGGRVADGYPTRQPYKVVRLSMGEDNRTEWDVYIVHLILI